MLLTYGELVGRIVGDEQRGWPSEPGSKEIEMQLTKGRKTVMRNMAARMELRAGGYKLRETGLNWCLGGERISGHSEGANQEGRVTEKVSPGKPCQAAARTSTQTTSQKGPGVLEQQRESREPAYLGTHSHNLEDKTEVSIKLDPGPGAASHLLSRPHLWPNSPSPGQVV